jgi:hypothetical protein
VRIKPPVSQLVGASLLAMLYGVEIVSQLAMLLMAAESPASGRPEFQSS